MQLDHLAVDLRPRNTWEALDLGAAMLREWWPRILRTWLAVFAPAAVVLALACYAKPWVAIALLWWLKPVFDRFVLHVASRAVFGESSDVRSTLALWREILSPGLLRSLTIARLSGARSFHLPVFQLERQSGRDASARTRVLDRRAAGTAYWLTIVCAHFEAVLMVSLGMLVAMFAPVEADEAARGISHLFFGNEDARFTMVDVGFYALAVTIVEPLYVASGLALYLNRRTQLEGWDIELAFRRMESRINPRGSRVMAALIAASLAFGMATWHPDAVAATDREAVQKSIKDVLSAPEFQEYKTEKVWKRRGGPPKPEPKPDRSWLVTLIQMISEIARAGAWVLAALAVVALLWLASRLRKPVLPSRKDERRAPDVLFGMDIRPESLPADPAAVARALAESGRVREALALLYRASLASLVHGHGVTLHEGATEGDALRAGTRVLGEPSGVYLTSLVTTWQGVAYAARVPDREAATVLADAWPRHFGAPPAGASR